MANIPSQVSKSAKQLAQDAARKIVKEPFEILKTAKSQVAGEEVLEPNLQGSSQAPSPQSKSPVEKALSEKVKEKDMRLIQALEQEIKEIREKKKKEEEEKKVEEAREAQVQREPKALVEPPAKKGRRLFGFGQKAQAERLKTRVEKPVPPSG